MKTDLIRVLVVVDQIVIRRGLAALLLSCKDLLLVGEARNRAEALEFCASAQPDVVLMDLLLPDTGSIEAVAALHEHFPEIHLIVLSNWDEHDLVQRVMAAGAEGYLLPNVSALELADAIRAASPAKAQKSIPILSAGLTSRVNEILALIARGLTNGQIEEELFISRATVKFHVSSILRKLGAVSRMKAVAPAVQIPLTVGPVKGSKSLSHNQSND